MSVVVMVALSACKGAPDEAATAPPQTTAAQPGAVTAQRGEGAPYEVLGSEVWDVPDPVSGRNYQMFVALPAGYADNPDKRYPVLYVTDADYAFPLVWQMARRLNVEGRKIEDFILVGLSYAKGEGGMQSRRRDYTPTANGPSSSPADAVHGGAGAYITYLETQALPFMAKRYRTDETRRMFLGHSYGALLGTQVMLERPQLFSAYILGSPSYWFDKQVMERRLAQAGKAPELPVRAYMYVGEYESVQHGGDADMVVDAQRMIGLLGARGGRSLQLKLDVLNDEDHLSVAPRGFMHGLKYLLAAPQG
ncbi:alpha/beta hydrolase-fold protein [Stenotrophomonas terrae]